MQKPRTALAFRIPGPWVTILGLACIGGSPNVAHGGYADYVTATVDGHFNFYEHGLVPSSALGLPAGAGLISSVADPSSTYLLQPYDAKNVLRLSEANRTGTMTFANPTLASSISLATCTGYAAFSNPVQSAIIHFSDGTPDASASFVPRDWNASDGAVLVMAGGRVTTQYFGSAPPDSFQTIPVKIFAESVSWSSAVPHPISSISFSWQGYGSNPDPDFFISSTLIFGISTSLTETGPYYAAELTPDSFNHDIVVEASAVPEPGLALPVILSGMFIGVRRPGRGRVCSGNDRHGRHRSC